MADLDFYIENIQQLPAVIRQGPTAQEKISQAFMEFIQLAHLYESAI
ncbi:MAG: hypothetical protein K2J37_06575 [Ruminococcus sp.]|nr:hypothetical protein [Ruminococcus sp.]